jgi:2-keto-4-pentenoate hydratase
MTAMSETTPIAIASHRLLGAWRTRSRASLADCMPADAAAAYAVQDMLLAALGPVGGWKVGAKGPDAEPTCAPLPASGILQTPAAPGDGAWRVRGIETEIAVRFERDLPERAEPYTRAEVEAAIGAVMPAIELVETRLAEFPKAAPLAMLADLGSHGGLVLGAAVPFQSVFLDAGRQRATQTFDGRDAAAGARGNPAQDLGRLLVWLANHCAARGLGLAAGQVVTTGSFTGMQFAPAGAAVRGEIAGLGAVEVDFT